MLSSVVASLTARATWLSEEVSPTFLELLALQADPAHRACLLTAEQLQASALETTLI
jgi:hypothetical protein